MMTETTTTRTDFGPFGEVLGEIMRSRGTEPTPEAIRALALEAGKAPEDLALEMHAKNITDRSAMCGCNGLERALALTDAEMYVLSQAYAYLSGSAEAVRWAVDTERWLAFVARMREAS